MMKDLCILLLLFALLLLLVHGSKENFCSSRSHTLRQSAHTHTQPHDDRNGFDIHFLAVTVAVFAVFFLFYTFAGR